ncbi:hypothetical protein SAMN02745157_0593 [Kaistia soli DSM 19436]|uniref:DUF6456 domain-containing protein n=1 Tax=Kaistia soli DSM 19436 TaxID=1122133 RepID=A0A1M4V2C8_9HYPH|nr:DUF6456 domain-containing protein [Kaistia soli]SHE63136.1 hypothetical protein SAMN02745157_0593 [Kaistia soli DSM 19436]
MKADASERRLARRLAGSAIHVELDAADEAWFIGTDGARRGSVDAEALRRLLARGALVAGPGRRYRLSEAGRSMVRRMLTGGDDLTGQHQTRERRIIETDGVRRAVTVDAGESPLGWLRTRKGRDGQPLIDDAAFAAGERLRADFTRGQMMPGITASWSPTSGASRGRGGGQMGGMADVTEAGLAARMRVERALRAVGPELSGVVLDFCCFLKGIDQIEGERGWPKRSAKLVLRLALDALARHYGYDTVASGSDRQRPG